MIIIFLAPGKWLMKLLPALGKLSKEKFGRWLAEVLSFDKTKNLNEDLVVSGHAVIKKY